VPRLVKFSGVMTDAAGKPAAGVVTASFSLYEFQEGGSPLWVETQNLQLDHQGRYTVLLGATQPEKLPLDLFYHRQSALAGRSAASPAGGHALCLEGFRRRGTWLGERRVFYGA